MELFKLLGTIAINGVDESKQALKSTAGEAQTAGTTMSSVFSGIGSAAVAVGKTVVSGLAVATTAISGLVAASVNSYADYEQLIGGVDTLFKDNSAALQAYAKNAYQTAGMSANEYMETVTGFSASLLQSLDNDTAAAVEKSNMAITDMSDNANKMGSDISAIQNAYAGFAKQNYTMLDNLKLGYGGTQEEMQRLLNDAQAISGIEYDVSSYADVVDAIHVIQTEMGITGTTAAEASSTIAGSIASMGSSWANLLTALSSDNLPVEDYVNAFANSVSTVADNLVPRIGVALDGVVTLITKLAPKIVKEIPKLLAKILPSVVSAATSLIEAIADTLPSLLTLIVESIPDLIEAVLSILDTVITTIIECLPEFLGAVQTIFAKIVEALPSLLTTILEALPALIPQLIEAIVALITILANNFSSIIQPIIDNLPTIITSIVDAIMANLPAIIEGLVHLTVEIVKALPKILLALFEALPTVMTSILEGLWEALPILLAGLGEIILTLLAAIGESVMGVGSIIGGAFSGAVEKIKEAFAPVSGFFSGIWEGIKTAFGSVTSWFSETFSGAWQAVLDVFSAAGVVFDGITEAISDVFTTVVNFLIDGINEVISVPFNAINGILNGISGIEIAGFEPFGGLWDKDPLAVPEIPKLREGGVLEKGQVGLLEGDGAEAVVPLHNNKKWISKVAEDMQGSLGNSEAVVNKLDELINAILGLKIYMNSDVLVGELTPAMDVSFGSMYAMKGRGQ